MGCHVGIAIEESTTEPCVEGNWDYLAYIRISAPPSDWQGIRYGVKLNEDEKESADDTYPNDEWHCYKIKVRWRDGRVEFYRDGASPIH